MLAVGNVCLNNNHTSINSACCWYYTSCCSVAGIWSHGEHTCKYSGYRHGKGHPPPTALTWTNQNPYDQHKQTLTLIADLYT